jgi:hypothetical protein
MARTQTETKRWARLLLPISFLLLIHLFFPHDHHYNSLHSEHEHEEQVYSVDVTDALLRVSSDPDSQCPATAYHVHALLPLLLPFILPLALFALLYALSLDHGRPLYFRPYLLLYHAPRGSMIGALRAPPVNE